MKKVEELVKNEHTMFDKYRQDVAEKIRALSHKTAEASVVIRFSQKSRHGLVFFFFLEDKVHHLRSVREFPSGKLDSNNLEAATTLATGAVKDCRSPVDTSEVRPRLFLLLYMGFVLGMQCP